MKRYTLVIHQNVKYSETITVEFSCAEEALACVASFPADETLSFELLIGYKEDAE